MARKQKHPEHVNHERWLVSWADFMTLLFAFFVVMFAVSQVDSKKVGRFTESFSKAVGVDMFPEAGKGLLMGQTEGVIGDPKVRTTKAGPIPDELASLKSALSRDTVSDPTLASVQIISKRNELVLRLSDNLLFASGNDALEDRAQAVVNALARQLKNRPVEIRVEGHTDNRPIRNARFRSNWDLSTARATSIVVALADQGIPAPRLSAAGYGEFHPIAPNETDDGRRANRRVDLVVTLPAPPDPAEAEAQKKAAEEDKAEADAKKAAEAKKTDEKATDEKADEKSTDEKAKKEGDESPSEKPKATKTDEKADDEKKPKAALPADPEDDKPVPLPRPKKPTPKAEPKTETEHH